MAQAKPKSQKVELDRGQVTLACMALTDEELGSMMWTAMYGEPRASFRGESLNDRGGWGAIGRRFRRLLVEG